MARQSQSWKVLEKATAKTLKGTRILRGADFSKSDVDVVVDDFPDMRIDSKYRIRHAHHKFLDEIKKKYCKKETDIPVLISKTHNQRGAVVSLSLEHFGKLLNEIRELRNKCNISGLIPLERKCIVKSVLISFDENTESRFCWCLLDKYNNDVLMRFEGLEYAMQFCDHNKIPYEVVKEEKRNANNGI
jgi:hypothetical protein